MNIKSNLKYIWLSVAVISLILLGFHWFGYDSQNLKNAILVLNGFAFILSVPCSLFYVPVAAAANYFMELGPFSSEGIYLNTFMLFMLGFMQWFWIARFWSPTEPIMQSIDLLSENKN